MAGTHLDTIVRTLAELKQEGLVATQYHTITILDEQALQAVAAPLTSCLKEQLL